MKLFLLCAIILLSGCAIFGPNCPNGYGQYVRVVGGTYKGKTGRLIEDCSGFENYKIELDDRHYPVCIHIWDLERL